MTVTVRGVPVAALVPIEHGRRRWLPRAELVRRLGVLAADDDEVRARRLATLDGISDIEVIPIDEAVAASWALLRLRIATLGRRLNVNDLWIAATSLTHGLPCPASW